MNSGKKKVIIITGATASGKTALSIEMAKLYKTDIISADSRQCFKELNIGVAKPTADELKSVKHYFINSHSIHDKVSAQTFETYALHATEEIFKHNDYAVMVGGTGLYIKAFCEGLDAIPEADENIRRAIAATYNEKGLAWLQERVRLVDPLYWETGERQNPHRLMRALEVISATGQSVNHFRVNEKKQRNFEVIKIGLDIPKTQLLYNINMRVDQMVEEGLVEEARELKAFSFLNALQTVGYKELFAAFEGSCTVLKAIEQIKINTRQYAKRQMTWFKRDKKIQWISSNGIDAMNAIDII